jgi:alpha-amylase/alpha-mannosidase (GH57 family)
MTQVAILWHMHQPYYEDLVTREHILPWVRLHALKDYYGMVALLEEFPTLRLTFNLVPSLLVQLEAYAENRARDRYLELTLKDAAALTDDEAAFMVRNFFHAQRERMIDAHPRYAELLARRGSPGADAHRMTVDDLRDLQVWQKLAWIDPLYAARDPRVRALIVKDRHFSEDDKARLREIELEILNAVIPAYRAAAARGQVELSTSPFYHPILPLLCDSDIYLRTHPDSTRPRHRFTHPEDAEEQLARAVQCHERLFGRRPAGLWPSEGSVSDAIVPLAAAAGFSWMATDEIVLARTLGVTFDRDDRGHLEASDQLYRPYAVVAGGRRISCLFRDHALSDLIGFAYAGWPAEAAADDFVARLVAAGQRFAERTGGEEAVIPIILDGENAWEHFEGGGRPFLRALYSRLTNTPELRTVTMSEASQGMSRELTGIFPGSWIDGNFYIWIGHRDDQRAWGQLAEARQALEGPREVDAGALAAAREEILIAEGSDWFWWYGDDHSSEHDREFDDLFRRHVRNVYSHLRVSPPDELLFSNISTGGGALESQPTALLTPTIDGEDTSYFEWLGAGAFEVRDAGGTMHRTERRPPELRLVQFGFDRTHLYVRIDGVRRMLDLLADGCELSLTFLQPAAVRFAVGQELGRLAGGFWERDAGAWTPRGPRDATLAAGTILEIGLPLANLGVTGGEVSFFVTLRDRGMDVARHPGDRPIETVVPDARFEARNWTA